MPSFKTVKSKISLKLRRFTTFLGLTEMDEIPTVHWLLTHHDKYFLTEAKTKGDTPLASLYRIYEYLVLNDMSYLRREAIDFYLKGWIIAGIPEPVMDTNPERKAILSCLPFILAQAFDELEQQLDQSSIFPFARDVRDREYEFVSSHMEPEWVFSVPALTEPLVIPYFTGEQPGSLGRSHRFGAMNIIVAEPSLRLYQ